MRSAPNRSSGQRERSARWRRRLAASTLGPSRSSVRRDSGWLATGTRSSRRFVLAPGCRSTSSPGRTRAGWPISRSQRASVSATGRSSRSTPAAAARSSRSATGRPSMNGSASTSVRSGSPSSSGWRRQCPRDVVADALAAIAAELARLDGRPRPDGVVAMGGAVTNLAAVKHGLATYDPDVVQGTLLDRAEIDRQIEQLPNPGRGGTAGDRRVAAGACRGHPRRRVHRPDHHRQARLRGGHGQRSRPAPRRAHRALRVGAGREEGRATSRCTRHADRDELTNVRARILSARECQPIKQ